MSHDDSAFPPVAHDAAAHRFTLAVDGQQAVLDYQLRDGAMVITHTGVPDALGGRGIAALLTRAQAASRWFPNAAMRRPSCSAMENMRTCWDNPRRTRFRVEPRDPSRKERT